MDDIEKECMKTLLISGFPNLTPMQESINKQWARCATFVKIRKGWALSEAE